MLGEEDRGNGRLPGTPTVSCDPKFLKGSLDLPQELVQSSLIRSLWPPEAQVRPDGDATFCGMWGNGETQGKLDYLSLSSLLVNSSKEALQFMASLEQLVVTECSVQQKSSSFALLH